MPGLMPLQEHAPVLARALSRDVRQALISPSSHPASLAEASVLNPPMTDHEIQYARDLSMLCHHALRFLSNVFRFKPLYLFFHGMRHCKSTATVIDCFVI